MTATANQTTSAADRRTCHRRPIAGRSAIWCDTGPEKGLLGLVSDISIAGFSARELAQPDMFKNRSPVHCVLLIQQAHFDCLAEPVSLNPAGDGDVKVGFRFQALSEHNQRLLTGVLHFLASQKAEEDACHCPQAEGVKCDPRNCPKLSPQGPSGLM